MQRVDYERTYNKQWDHDNQTWLQRRTTLEKVIIFLLVLTGSAFLGVLGFHALKHKANDNGCTTRHCLRTASEIATNIDPNSNPCEDFVEFSCGNFKKNAQESSKISVKNLVERQIKEIIQEPIDEKDHYMINVQKKLFEKCMDVTTVAKESLQIFNDHLEELNGWPVVVDHYWAAKHFDWQEMIFALKQKGYLFSMLLYVAVVSDPIEPNKFIVSIHPPKINVIDEAHKKLYKNYMLNVSTSFGANEVLAGYEMEEVLEFVQNLTKIAGRNDWDGLNETEHIMSIRLTVKEFQENHNEIDWLVFINNMLFPATNVTLDDYVIFPKTKYVDAFFYLIHRTRRRTQANYIIWKVLENIMPFMPDQIKQFGSNYTCLTHKPLVSRFDVCKDVIYSNLYLQPSEVLYARKYLPIEKKEAVEKMIKSINFKFAKNLNESLEGNDEILERATSMVEVVGMQGDFYNDTIFDFYDSYNFTLVNNETEAFLDLLLEMSVLHTNFLYSRYNSLRNETPLQSFASLKVKYSKEDNAFIVPAGILQEIYYDEGAPMFANYGSLGAMIAYELVYGFIRTEIDENNFWWNKTSESILDVLGCTEEYLNSTTNLTVVSSLQIDDVLTTKTIAKYVAEELSFRAYQNWIEENEEETQLAGIDYTTNQMFWIFTILPQCHKLTTSGVFQPFFLNGNFRNDFECFNYLPDNCVIV